MSKFWSAIAILILTSFVLLASETNRAQITFSELENECRYNTPQYVDTDLTSGGKILFEGTFHVDSVEATPRYRYTQKNKQVRLNVYTDRVQRPTSFWETCLGAIKYSAKTSKLEQGNYLVKVLHNGEKVDEKIYKVS